MYAAEVRRREMWPEDMAAWTWQGGRGLLLPPENVVERETEIGAAYVRAMDALDACYTRLDPICSRTLSCRARPDRGCAGNQLKAARRGWSKKSKTNDAGAPEGDAQASLLSIIRRPPETK